MALSIHLNSRILYTWTYETMQYKPMMIFKLLLNIGCDTRERFMNANTAFHTRASRIYDYKETLSVIIQSTPSQFLLVCLSYA